MLEQRQSPSVRVITAAGLTDRFGGSRRFWERRRPRMVRGRLLRKVGRVFFGDLDEIANALARGSFPDAAGDPLPDTI